MLAFYVTLQTLLADRVQASKDRGATAVEYGLMVGLIALGIIVTVTALGTRLDSLFTAIKDGIPIVAS